jgi:hypothetical protein
MRLHERAHAAPQSRSRCFTTMTHCGALGALLTFSTTQWYGLHAEPSDLGDQQLGGLIM